MGVKITHYQRRLNEKIIGKFIGSIVLSECPRRHLRLDFYERIEGRKVTRKRQQSYAVVYQL